MNCLISLTSEEKALAEAYAVQHGMSLEQAFKRALFDIIESEYDVAVAEVAYREYVESGKESRPIAEL